ncbi:hypothetical protein [Bradyrhizobium elkanii]|uniref:hypothetical protein n=1 Tax=Bradyrhizobium elkanii TaxID=29448 RepID=UPI0004AF1D11|nr:hypothetical protein [Bradyrhizobium elkanii]WLC11813.1 hypothetical protein QIH86_21355 [Bradyrhizobium elkanii USDA 94]
MAGRRNNNDGDNRAKLDKIYEVFDKHNVPVDRGAIWEVQGTPVVKHKDVERLGAAMGIKWEKPQILRAEAYEAVIIVFGSVGDKSEWSIGEAKIMEMIDTGRKNNWGKAIREPKEGTFGNYVVTGNQAAYPYAMAEKRAKDRVILKLADLHGDAYSSEEADDFRQADNDERSDNRRDNRGDSRSDAKPAANDDKPPAREASVSKEDGQAIVQHWVKQIDEMTRTKQAMDIAASKEFIADMKKLSSNGEDYVMGKLSDKSQELKRAAHAG